MTFLYIILAFIAGFFVGGLSIQRDFRNRGIQIPEPEKEIVPESTSILIEKHNGVYYAYDQNDNFRGQDMNLETLILNQLGGRESIKILVEDPVVQQEVISAYEHLQASGKPRDSNQEPTDRH